MAKASVLLPGSMTVARHLTVQTCPSIVPSQVNRGHSS
jgi:hypothetical protein